MRKRRAERLTRENRTLINEVDLKEPQMREEKPLSVIEAIRDVSLNNRMAELVEKHEQDGVPFQEAVEVAAGEIILKVDMHRYTNIPIEIEGPMPEDFGRTALDGPPAEETTPEPLAMRPGRVSGKRALTDAQRQEIREAYVSGLEVEEICRAYDIGMSTLYRIAAQAGLSRRTRQAPILQEETVTASKTSPVVSPNGSSEGLTEWLVTYQVTRTETVVVAARDFNSAAQAVETDGSTSTVISVARKV